MTTDTTGDVTSLIASGEALYTAVAGETISARAASNINDAGAVVSLVVNLADRNITRVNVGGIVGGLTGVLDGVTSIVQATKAPAATTAA